MEYKDLYTTTLVLIMIVLIAGIAVLLTDKMATQVRNTITSNNEVVEFSNVTDGGEAYGTPTYFSDLISLISVYDSDGVELTNYTYTADTNITVYGYSIDGNFNVTYTFYEDSTATDSLQAARDAVTTINTQWMSILILIIIMSIVIGIVITSFVKYKR